MVASKLNKYSFVEAIFISDITIVEMKKIFFAPIRFALLNGVEGYPYRYLISKLAL